MLRKNLFKSTAVALGVFYVGLSYAVPPPISEDSLQPLAQEEQHSIASKRIAALFTRSHYKHFVLDDQMSQKIFDLYLQALDYNRSVLTAADVANFESFRNEFADALQSGDLKNAYAMFNLSTKRRFERYAYALSLLDQTISFDGADKYEFDRSKSPWAKDESALNEIWRQRVKNDELNLELAGKKPSEIKELLVKRYSNAIKRLKQDESEDVFQSLMNAFARSIDPHTSYLSPRNAERFNSEMNLSLEGIGAVLQADDDFTVVRSLIPGGPADKAKLLRPDDRITGVGQDSGKIVDVIGWRLDDVVELIKGRKGTKVRLEIQRGKGTTHQTQMIELVRDKVRLEDRAAKSQIIQTEGKKIGVIEVPSFYVNLHLDVEKELAKLKAQKIDGLLIDLRNDGGGALTEATDLTGLFMKQGPVVQIRDAMGRIAVNEDTDGKSYYDGPMAVLIDRYSASASEIFAAAMNDYGRALIIGENSFGKGTVQQHRALGKIYDFFDKELGHVQYTIAKFYRINGGSTQNKGVQPDISFPPLIDPKDTGESVEPNALPWDKIQPAQYTKLGDFTAVLPKLKALHEQRVKSDPEFKYAQEDIAWYQAEKAKKYISLNEADRIKDRNTQEAKALERDNERLTRMGKPMIKSLTDLPPDIKFPDGYLNEAANITADLVKLSKS
ncbi:carboxy terminal-processing peptidase [Tolumonas lignilytica]|uniref:carboxy terminal-processing peptidase n=1 Tax=Tolumonas lignilytica TaxID=1283284 RepID=UPI000464C0D1